MNKNQILLLTVMLILNIGCANYWTYVNSSYIEMRPKESSLLIVLKDMARLNYEGSVENEFGKGDPVELATNYVLSQLNKEFEDKPAFTTVNVKLCNNGCTELKKSFLPYFGSKMFEIHLPDFGKSEPFDSDDISYILFLEDLIITSELKIGNSIPPEKYLAFDSKFAIWDNKAHNVVSWGRVTASDTATLVIRIREWNTVALKFCDKLLKETPFCFEKRRFRLKEVIFTPEGEDNE